MASSSSAHDSLSAVSVPSMYLGNPTRVRDGRMTRRFHPDVRAFGAFFFLSSIVEAKEIA